ncbi:antitoxin component YwqK of YwqJK toxin-antitoxin module [Flavobacterium arsenatis]|uniref:Antitoxin component YwqK of YwqJK toxin-antitoxin module n=1 Tax=Flavobacterium arsenatis TaxID=1484332 RepID=A0ABU1TRG2_9FLAO|nr:hypothetical protein [Flavobacterium arsenatis]MDR6968451.1 antitoxin component YwqK of YwqJK toxin-antitoxin module [Flavobacterium arsenatis]
MKIIKHLMLCVFLMTLSQTSAQNDFNKTDANGKKHGLWKGVHEESKRPRYEGTFEHGIEVGTFKYFDDTKAGSLIATRDFSENGKVAYTIVYDQKNNIVSEGKTVNRVNEGLWKYYQKESKQVMSEENYVKGKLEGIRKVYFREGKIAEETQYANGKKNGLSKVYTENGTVIEEATYKNGQYEGPAIYREPNGNIASKGNYKNGAKHGTWQFFVNGKLKKEEKYPKKVKFEKRTDIPKQ